jgi:hypothetical protein
VNDQNFQEKTYMKKMLFVLCVVMLASLIASAQLVSPTTYDRAFSGYCDGYRLVLQKLTSSGTGSSKIYVGGFHDLVDLCGLPTNASVVGQKHGTGANVPPHQIVGVSGPVLDTADADFDAQCQCFSGVQAEYLTDLVHEYAALYRGYLGFNGDYFCCDAALTIGLPAKNGNAVTKPPMGGSIAAARKQQ